MVSRRISTPSQMPDEYAERRRNSVSIAHGKGEAIVGDEMIIGNLKRGRAGEKDMRVRDVSRVFCVHFYDLPRKEIQESFGAES